MARIRLVAGNWKMHGSQASNLALLEALLKGMGDPEAAAEKSLNGQGRVLLRPSGTEPVLRVMVEGEPRDTIESAANSIAEAVRQAAR